MDHKKKEILQRPQKLRKLNGYNLFARERLQSEGTNVILYIGNVWRGESLANLANEHNFAKLKPSKRHICMHVT